jgi:hypothetical protein
MPKGQPETVYRRTDNAMAKRNKVGGMVITIL